MGSVKFILLLVVSMSFFCSLGLEGETQRGKKEAEVEGTETKMVIIDAVKSLCSLPTTWDFWLLPKFVRSYLKQGWPCFPSCPNLDFRREKSQGEEGAKEKVKEAVVRSLDESKALVEESARSAAHVVDSTVNKLKKTLSGKRKDEEVEEF